MSRISQHSHHAVTRRADDAVSQLEGNSVPEHLLSKCFIVDLCNIDHAAVCDGYYVESIVCCIGIAVNHCGFFF